MKKTIQILLWATMLVVLITVVGMLAIHVFTSNEYIPGFLKESHMALMSGTKYFSADYATARKKFIDATKAGGIQVESIQNPRTGPQGELLFTDVAFTGPKDASVVLVLSSGLHGVEGFAGSAIQTGLLHQGLSRSLPQGVAVLMVHAVNPYGMAHLRRFNEDNIDLNRNFVDHSAHYPFNQDYQALADIIGPESLTMWENMKARAGFLWYGVVHGKGGLQAAISGGQYRYPQGLFYGGREEAWSNRVMRNIVERHLTQAGRVVLVDIHTGLGPHGAAEIIISEKEMSPALKRALAWWGARVKNTQTGDSVSTQITGPLKTAFVQMLQGTEVTAVSLEFGTHNAIDVFWALRDENWLHHHAGQDHHQAKEIKSNLLRVFRPDSREWEVSVWHQGREVVHQVLEKIAR